MIVKRLLSAATLMVAMSVYVKLDTLEMGLLVKVNNTATAWGVLSQHLHNGSHR